jgi:protein-L-isoaspartate O-methyltransferase
MRRKHTLVLILVSVVAVLAAGRASVHAADVVYVSTPHDVVAKMLEIANVTKDDVVYDLGCGDGRIVVTAAKRHGCKAVGYDIEKERVEQALLNVKKARVENLVSIQQEDVFSLDLRPADVITLYLLPNLNVKLIPQLEQLKPGSRIVSHEFDMKGVKPDKVVKLRSKEDNVEHTIYLWTTPLTMEKKANEPYGLEPVP